MTIRRNAANMTNAQINQFCDVVKRLAQGARSFYSLMTQAHIEISHHRFWNRDRTESGDLHSAPILLPWHSAFLRYFEIKAQEILEDETFGVPYWNWSTDHRGARCWSWDFLGGNGTPPHFYVPNGPFKQGDWEGITGHPIIRNFGGSDRAPDLPGLDLTLQALMQPTWTTFYPDIGGLHGSVHEWVGGYDGDMTMVASSPNDPAFWLHHSNVDRLFQIWLRLHRYQPYAPMENGIIGFNFQDHMWPDQELLPSFNPRVSKPWDRMRRDSYYDTDTGDLSNGSTIFLGTFDEGTPRWVCGDTQTTRVRLVADCDQTHPGSRWKVVTQKPGEVSLLCQCGPPSTNRFLSWLRSPHEGYEVWLGPQSLLLLRPVAAPNLRGQGALQLAAPTPGQQSFLGMRRDSSGARTGALFLTTDADDPGTYWTVGAV